MKKKDIISAWRDQDAFENLSADEKNLLPANPVGIVEVATEDLIHATGGDGTHYSHCEPTATWCDDCGGGKIIR